VTDLNRVLEVRRADLGDTRILEQPLPTLAPGHVRFRIDRLALTANTVTYAVTGDVLGYWSFYPGPDPDWGRVPAMGWAEIVASNHPDVPAGGRYYGWYPMADFVDIAAAPAADGVRDDGPHRAAHAPVYRAFVDSRRDPFHEVGEDAEERQALLRGLFVTGWLAADYFADNGWFGASRVLVLSASSKTALAFACCADACPGIEVIGVTSARNHAFTCAVGCYDEVVTYDEIDRIPAGTPIVSIDMSGSGPVLGAVHTHFGRSLHHSMAVGRSHHESAPRAEGLPGPKPAFFFAPAQVKKRVQDWGYGEYQRRVAGALSGFVAGSRQWLGLQHAHGPAALATRWQEMHAGRVPPDVGLVVSMREGPGRTSTAQ
jgi:hypothetical protein